MISVIILSQCTMDIEYLVFNLKNYVSTNTIYAIISYFYRDLSSVAPLANDINRFCTSDNFLYQFIIRYGILYYYMQTLSYDLVCVSVRSRRTSQLKFTRRDAKKNKKINKLVRLYMRIL